jgi:hypothetical protein
VRAEISKSVKILIQIKVNRSIIVIEKKNMRKERVKENIKDQFLIKIASKIIKRLEVRAEAEVKINK